MATLTSGGVLRRKIDLGGGAWPLMLGFAVIGLPTLLRLANQDWSTDFGGQGPVVLATGGWLLWRTWPTLRENAAPGLPWLTAIVLAAALVFYVFGRAYDVMTLEAGGVYGAGLAMLHARFGARAMAKTWFPLLYLAFAVPPPSWLLDSVTAPLKHFVAYISTSGLAALGLPVAREGVTIVVAQYQLFVADACSGMNSIVGLTAVSLLYIYLMRGSSLIYSLVLTAFVIPIAIAANIVRISILVLLTYFCGDEVAESFIHPTTGLILFATSLFLVFGLDRLVFFVLGKLRRAE
jgi:exosortase